MKDILIEEYNTLEQHRKVLHSDSYEFNINFINGGFVEILGDKPAEFKVEFIDRDTDKVIHETIIKNNMWTRTNIQYYVNFLIRITNLNSEKVIEYLFNANNKRVYVALESKAIGDTLAWFPYLEEFRKKHGCKLICSTFHNEWFKSEYPEIEFVEPGEQVSNLYAMYKIGWFYNEDDTVNLNLNPSDFKKVPLQQTCSDILGLEYKEIKPKLSFEKTKSSITNKYVCIAPHASAHAKYWNKPGGWQLVIDYIKDLGYEVIMITKEELSDKWHDSKLGGELKGVIDKTGDYPLSDRANDIMNSEFFIGVGSGLSWLSWALGTPTILISGFSDTYTEFQDCKRIINKNVCNSCFNEERLDAGDWDWCPKHKGTVREFECTKNILPIKVFEAINEALGL